MQQPITIPPSMTNQEPDYPVPVKQQADTKQTEPANSNPMKMQPSSTNINQSAAANTKTETKQEEFSRSETIVEILRSDYQR